MPIVTLLTDFGLRDTYVGQMKGAILAVAPAARLVDLTHGVPSQDVFAGAFLLWTAVEVFPPGTVHVAVVDPGVGSPRRGLAVRSGRGDVLVGPDNGLLAPAVDRLGGPQAIVELRGSAFLRTRSPSTTFHGRDIFGPVAGHLANGESLDRLGPPAELSRPFELTLAHGLTGHVIHVDGFGNLVTDVPAANLPERFQVRLGQRVVDAQPAYAAAQPGELVALIGSAGLLEIAARDASAAAITGAVRGSRVIVEPASS